MESPLILNSHGDENVGCCTRLFDAIRRNKIQSLLGVALFLTLLIGFIFVVVAVEVPSLPTTSTTSRPNVTTTTTSRPTTTNRTTTGSTTTKLTTTGSTTTTTEEPTTTTEKPTTTTDEPSTTTTTESTTTLETTTTTPSTTTTTGTTTTTQRPCSGLFITSDQCGGSGCSCSWFRCGPQSQTKWGLF